MTIRDTLLVLGVVFVWGVNFIAIRWGVDEVQPLLLTALRYLAAALPAVFFIRRPKVALGILIAYGLAVGVGQFGLLFTAIKFGMPTGLSSIVMQLQAFFTIALAVMFLGERPHPAQLIGALVAFSGIAVIGVEQLGEAAIVPFLMAIAAAVFWGVANVITKAAGKIDMLAFVIWSSLVPPIPLYLLSLIFEGPDAVPLALGQITIVGIASILFMAWVSTIFAYGAWSTLIGRYPASTVAPFTLLVPIIGIASAALVLGEDISVIELAGSVFVFAGLLLNVFGPRLATQVRSWRGA